MDITQIELLLAHESAAKGYDPLIISEEGIDGAIRGFPTAWIQLPKVLYVEGREEGVICHKIVVTLLDDYNGYSIEQKGIRLKQMQEDALEIMQGVSLSDSVVEISSLTITPRIVTTTAHGDIAQLCEASIVTYF